MAKKARKVRKVIANLPKYKIHDLAEVTPEEYKLIRLAVINSIKGEAIAREERSRQRWVERVFLAPAKKAGYLTYSDTSASGKCDFQGEMENGLRFGLEVKGGEGNSVTLLSRPAKADLLCVWSHLDVMSNTPGDNIRAVLGRVVKQMVNDDEKKQQVDYLVFYDKWYKSGVKTFKQGEPYPDVIVFPEAIPTEANPHPSLPDPSVSYFLEKLYEIVGKKASLENDMVKQHIWLCALEVYSEGGVWFRKMTVRNWRYPDISLGARNTLKAKIKPIASL